MSYLPAPVPFIDNWTTSNQVLSTTVIQEKVGIETTGVYSSLGISGGVTIGNNYASQSVSDGTLIVSGNIGINTVNPTGALHVTGKFIYQDFQQNYGLNKILVSDSSGVATWNNYSTIPFPVITVTGNYSGLATDYYILVDTVAAAAGVNVSVPNPITLTGKSYVIKDKTGSGQYNNITISAAVGLVERRTAYVINTSGGSADIFSNGVDYFTK